MLTRTRLCDYIGGMQEAQRGARHHAEQAGRADPNTTHLPLALTPGQVAIELQYVRRDGKPDRNAVYDLIRTGALAAIDQTQALTRWRVSRTELLRYVAEGPRT